MGANGDGDNENMDDFDDFDDDNKKDNSQASQSGAGGGGGSDDSGGGDSDNEETLSQTVQEPTVDRFAHEDANAGKRTVHVGTERINLKNIEKLLGTPAIMADIPQALLIYQMYERLDPKGDLKVHQTTDSTEGKFDTPPKGHEKKGDKEEREKLQKAFRGRRRLIEIPGQHGPTSFDKPTRNLLMHPSAFIVDIQASFFVMMVISAEKHSIDVPLITEIASGAF